MKATKILGAQKKLDALIARAERENPKALADAFRRAVLVRRGLTLTRTSKGPVLSFSSEGAGA